jgi:hypothetical protein
MFTPKCKRLTPPKSPSLEALQQSGKPYLDIMGVSTFV